MLPRSWFLLLLWLEEYSNEPFDSWIVAIKGTRVGRSFLVTVHYCLRHHMDVLLMCFLLYEHQTAVLPAGGIIKNDLWLNDHKKYNVEVFWKCLNVCGWIFSWINDEMVRVYWIQKKITCLFLLY